jgi:hypothetical protein
MVRRSGDPDNLDGRRNHVTPGERLTTENTSREERRMQRVIQATPEELFASATAFMVNAGASVEGQTANSITFSAKLGVSTSDYVWGGILALMDLGAAMSDTTTLAVMQDQNSTLVAVRQGEETQVTISDGQRSVDNLLRFWLIADVLREPLPNPMKKVQASYSKVLIWNDRVELYTRIMFWKLAETVMMDDVEDVEIDKRWVHLWATDGRELSIKGVSRDDAQMVKQMIDSRLTVHRSPRLGEGR